MKKFVNLCAASLAALVLAACGGGGGDSTVAPPVSPPSPPPSASVTCPDGTSAATAAACPAVTATTSVAAGATVDPSVLNQGLTVKFSGTISPSGSSNTFLQAGAALSGTATPNATNNAVTFLPSIRAGYGMSDEFMMDINDALGRPIHVDVKFATSAMSCANNAVWSNPATFSAALGSCVAPVGVQTILDKVNNRMQDTSCTLSTGAKVPDGCAKYATNGTFVFSDTTMPVQDHSSVVWMVYFGSAGQGSIALVDKATLVVISRTSVSPNIGWIIGNPTGAAIQIDGVTHQMAYTVVNGLASIQIN